MPDRISELLEEVGEAKFLLEASLANLRRQPESARAKRRYRLARQRLMEARAELPARVPVQL